MKHCILCYWTRSHNGCVSCVVARGENVSGLAASYSVDGLIVLTSTIVAEIKGMLRMCNMTNTLIILEYFPINSVLTFVCFDV